MFPTKKELSSYRAAVRRVEYLKSGLEQDVSKNKVSQAMLAAILAATKQGFPSKEIPTVAVEIEGDPLMNGALYEQLIARQQSRKEGLVVSWDDFLGLSIRERGRDWADIKACIEELQEHGYRLVEIRVKMEEGVLDRSWNYPATITIAM